MNTMADFSERIRQLSDVKKQLLAKRLHAIENSHNTSASTQSNARLAAFFVPNEPDASKSTELQKELREHLASKVPQQLIPSVFVPLDSLPRLPNGKVDRNSLPHPDRAIGEESENRDGDVLDDDTATAFDSPTTELEKTLAAIWIEVLGCGMVGRTDDFFEVGGDSLLAIQIVSRVHEAGLVLTPTDIFERRTIENIASHIEENKEQDIKETSDSIDEQEVEQKVRLIPLQPNGSRPPIYFIHILGEGFEYSRAILPYLNPDQPVYGITTMIDGMELDDGDITPYVETLLRQQPTGPYYLVGIFCGGREAFKLARVMQDQGQDVAWLGLVQATTDRTVFKHLPFHKRLFAHLQNLRRTGWSYLRNRLERRRQEKSLPLDLLVAHQNFRFESDDFDGRISLFRLANIAPFVEPELGWKEFTSEPIEIRDVPGNWNDMFEEPHVATLGKEIRESIEEAIRRRSV